MQDPLAQLRAQLLAAGKAEEALRTALEEEQARTAALERELNSLRSSESFRIGHLLVEGFGRHLVRRPSAFFRGFSHFLTSGRRAGGRARTFRWTQREPRLPVAGPNTVLFIAWGVDAARLREYVGRVERLQTMLVDLHPVFLVDSVALEPMRERGYGVEYVIPLNDWREQRPAHEWGAYLTQRIAALRDLHRPLTVVVFDEDGARSALDQGVLNALVLPAIGGSDDNELAT